MSARAELRRQLDASEAADLASALIEQLAAIKEKALAAGKIKSYDAVGLHLYASGRVYVTEPNKEFSSVTEAMAALDAWASDADTSNPTIGWAA